MRHRLVYGPNLAKYRIVRLQGTSGDQRIDRPFDFGGAVKVRGGEASPEKTVRRRFVCQRFDLDVAPDRLAGQLEPGAIDLDPGRIRSKRLIRCQVPVPLLVGSAPAEPRTNSRPTVVSQLWLE
jgi:hypothetical protein